MVRLLTLLLTACALALAACGDDDSASSSSGKPSSGGFPATIEQKLGAVTIERPPERVVALDFPSADAAIALGVVPVGMYKVSYVQGGIQEWTKAALAGKRPELIGTDQGFPFEQIARLRPDVILATQTYPLIADSWDKLNKIAPVVGHVRAPGVDSWQQGVRQVGKALGRSERAEQLIAKAEGAVRRARATHREFAGKTVSFFNYAAGYDVTVINDDDDFSIKFLRELGFEGVTRTIAALKGNAGRAPVSPERYRLLDADVILGTSPDPKLLDKLKRDRLFTRVPAIARGAFVGFGIGPATAMAFPSVLSVPYAVDELVPQLSRALAAKRG